MKRLAACLLLYAASPATAELRPQSEPEGDPRVQSVVYDPQEVVLIEASPGYQVSVQLSPGEQIDNVAVGDSAAWQVSASKRGDFLFVKPVQPGVTSNMTVVTDARTYAFTLAPAYGGIPPYSIRFRYPPPATAVPVETADMMQASSWRMSGDAGLRPQRIEGDGTHLYLSWPADTTIPAIFAADASGREALVNGMMRGDQYVIDGTPDQLVFRLDKRLARAKRVSVRSRR